MVRCASFDEDSRNSTIDAGKPLVFINLSALPPSLFSSVSYREWAFGVCWPFWDGDTLGIL